MAESLRTLFDTLPQIGTVRWIATRPERGAPGTYQLSCQSGAYIERQARYLSKPLDILNS